MKKLITILLISIAIMGTLAVPTASALPSLTGGDEIGMDGQGISDGDAGVPDEALADEDTAADSESDDSGSSSEGVNTSMPSIPKPDILPGPSEGSSQSQVQNYFRAKAIPTFTAAFIGIVGLVSFVALLVAGIQFLTAYGNEESLSKAKRTAMFAAIGFVLAILSYAIVSIISSLSLGANMFDIPTVQAANDTQLESHVDQLLPSEESLIEASPNAQGVSLPSGDLATDIVPQIVNILLAIASTVMFLALAYAGILLLIARGNEEDITKAQNIIIYAVIGIVIIALSYAIIYGIARLNINA